MILLGLGILAFPLLFETAPRPIAVDLPIEIPRRDAVPPLPSPAAAPAIAPTVNEEAKPQALPEPKVEAKADPAPAVAPTPTPTPEPKIAAKPAPKADDGARARALLEGKASPAVKGERWIVQIGAFAEDRTVRDVRARAGKVGLTTFTQVVAVDSGERTRVRVGPFDGRDAADAAAAKLQKAGLPASVMKL